MGKKVEHKLHKTVHDHPPAFMKYVIAILGVYVTSLSKSVLKESVLKSLRGVKVPLGSNVVLGIEALFLFIFGNLFCLADYLITGRVSHLRFRKEILISGFCRSLSIIFSFYGATKMSYMINSLIRSSKCLAIVISAVVISNPKYKKKLNKENIYNALIIVFGLIVFNFMVSKLLNVRTQ